ncbi:hypothetical protein QVD17_33189 [Tagetes erecta]|uniref:Uncharacterized protein n=1 Tax=Tagetes erecta TaxID=13708 RepID=A0AAD8NKZ8_TARER|nr:hypothetical protein QVD17_33189 [Tagetes erecta]
MKLKTRYKTSSHPTTLKSITCFNLNSRTVTEPIHDTTRVNIGVRSNILHHFHFTHAAAAAASESNVHFKSQQP